MALTVRIRGDASQFDKTMRGVKGTIGGLSSKIAGIGAAALGAATAYMTLSSAFEAVKSASEKAAGMEDLTNQLGLLTGSSEKAKSMIKLFRDEAAKSPLSSENYAQAAKTLMAFGMEADKTMPILKALGDISMGNADRFEGLALAFAQVTSRGRLMGQEVNQMTERGFNPLQQISARTGESMDALTKRMEKGAVSASEVKQAFIDATSAGGKFYGAIQKGANSTNAKLAQTKDNIDKLQIAFGTGFNEGLKDALDATNSFLPQLEKRFAAAGDFIGAAMTDALSGNTKKFQLIGNLMGAVLAEGVKTGFEKLIMGTIENVMVDYAEWFQQNQRRANMETKNQLMDKALQETNPAKREKLVQAAQGIGDFSTIREQYNLGDAYSKKSSDFMSGIRSQLNDVNLEMAIEKGIKTGIDMSMSQAVREGVLEAWARQPQGAKFAN